jgi:hypothetical protein
VLEQSLGNHDSGSQQPPTRPHLTREDLKLEAQKLSESIVANWGEQGFEEILKTMRLEGRERTIELLRELHLLSSIVKASEAARVLRWAVADRTATDANITNQGQRETGNPHINVFDVQNALKLLKTKFWKDLVEAGEEEEWLEHEVRVSRLAADLRPIFEDHIWLVLKYARQGKSEPDKGREHQTLAQRSNFIEYSDMDEKAKMLFTEVLDKLYQGMVQEMVFSRPGQR